LDSADSNSRPPKQIPHLPLLKNSRLLQILNKQIPQVCPGGDVKVSIWFPHYQDKHFPI
jgi:hypothetical protein